ncbi:MAG: hypothetical protein ACOC8D_03140 [bacterium]
MPPVTDSLRLLYHHLGLGLVAALLFAAGLGTSVAVVRRDMRWLMALPLWLVRQVLRVIGPGFPPVRVFLIIFCFNTVAIFLYMASGVLVVVPALVAFLTGVNIGVIVLKAGEVEMPSGERPLGGAMAPDAEVEVAPWVSLCSLAVLALELPSFWLSVGMGIGMGRELTEVGGYTLAHLGSLLSERAAAYVTVIIPILFLSALAETAAIRGHVRARPAPPAEDDQDPG